MAATTDDLRARLGRAAVVAAPLVLLGGALAHPSESTDAARQLDITARALDRWYIAHLLYMVGFVLFVPAVLTLGRTLRDRAPLVELWGTSLTVIGLFSSAGIVAVEGFGGWQLAQIADRPAATDALHRLVTSAGVVVPFALIGLAVPVGLIVLAVGIGRTGTTAPWVAWTLGAGAVLLGVGLGAALRAALVAGLAGIAIAMAASTGSDDETPPVGAPGERSRARLAAR